jgi:hypothetical protein
MKKLLFALSLILLISSCTKDETFSREDYIGSWTVEENSTQNGTTKFTVHMKEGTGTDDIIIENFYNFGFQYSVKGNVIQEEITIPKQNFSVNREEVSGSGTMVSKTKINLTYSVKDTTGTDNVVATLTKQ